MAEEDGAVPEGTLSPEAPAPVDQTPVEQAPAEQAQAEQSADEQAPARRKASAKKAYVARPGNCAGDLEAVPDVAGTTYHKYKCQVCGQIVHVGQEDLEANGLPPEHAQLLEEGN